MFSFDDGEVGARALLLHMFIGGEKLLIVSCCTLSSGIKWTFLLSAASA